MQLYLAPRGAAPQPPTSFWTPLGHPNPLKIAPARALCAKVRARVPQNTKKQAFGGPGVAKGANMEPKRRQIGAKKEPKIEVSKKSAES